MDDGSLSEILKWCCDQCNKTEYYTLSFAKDTFSRRGRIVCKSCRPIDDRIRAVKRNGSLEDLPKSLQELFDEDKNVFPLQEYNLNFSGKVWFKCKFGHSFDRPIRDFKINPSCPICHTQTSKQELRIFTELDKYFDDLIWQATLSGREFDIYSQTHKFTIEIDGSYWHKDKSVLDEQKNHIAKSLGIDLVRYRYKGMQSIGHTFFAGSDKERDYEKEFRNFCVFLIEEKINFSLSSFAKHWLILQKFQATDSYLELLVRLPGPREGKSFADLHPELAREWADENLPIHPTDVWPNTDTPYFWICKNSKYHGSYSTTPLKRIQGRGCPACAGRVLATDNSLLALKPIIAERWNFEKNYPLKPENVLAGSTKIYWFKCAHGHEWQDRLYDVKNSEVSRPCKQCKSVAFISPDIASEWDYQKNPESPDFVPNGSNKDFWWLCKKCGNSFKQAVVSRTKSGHGCPKHRHEKIWAKRLLNIPYERSLAFLKPEAASRWDYESNTETPEKFSGNSNQKRFFICPCGNSVERVVSSLRKGREISCRCSNRAARGIPRQS